MLTWGATCFGVYGGVGWTTCVDNNLDVPSATFEATSRGGVRNRGSGEVTEITAGTDETGVASCPDFLECFPGAARLFLPLASSCLPFMVPPACLTGPLVDEDCNGSSLSSVELILRVTLEGESFLPCCSSDSGWMGTTVSLRQY